MDRTDTGTPVPQEVWRPVVGYDGRYEVSDQGRVRSLINTYGNERETPFVVKARPQKTGYRKVTLHRDGIRKTCLVHRLVMASFKGDCPIDQECRHLDGDPSNNRLDNLSWGTRAQNVSDRETHGTTARGERHGMSKLNDSHVIAIRNDPRSGPKIASDYGVTRHTVSLIKLRKIWTRV